MGKQSDGIYESIYTGKQSDRAYEKGEYEKVYHLRLKGNHYEMGVKRGKIFNRGNISFPLHLDDFQMKHGRESEKLLREFFPEVCEEIRGVSDTIGADYLTFASWMLCMGCCMYNLEQNIPVKSSGETVFARAKEVRGCTAFAYEKEGRVIYGRNNDLPPYLRDGCKSEMYAPDGGRRFQITTSSFINGEEGLNEHGLAVAMTFVMTDLNKIEPGFNSCFIVRYLLEKAKDAKEALSLLFALPIASNCNILLADRNGEMAVAECTPFLKRVREAERFGESKIICTVNSFTSDEMRKYDDARGNDYDSHRRYATVMNGFCSMENCNGVYHNKKTGTAIESYIEWTKKLLKGDYGFICQYDNEPDFETVWSSVFDIKSLLVYRAEGDPRKRRFVEDCRLQKFTSTSSDNPADLSLPPV